MELGQYVEFQLCIYFPSKLNIHNTEITSLSGLKNFEEGMNDIKTQQIMTPSYDFKN